MVKSPRIFLPILIIFLCSCGQREIIKGTIGGMTNDTILVQSLLLDDITAGLVSDTVIAKNGKFFFSPTYDKDAIVTLYPLQGDIILGGQIYRPESMTMTVILPKDKKIKIDGNIKGTGWIEYFAGDTEENKELSKLSNSWKPLEIILRDIDIEVNRLYTTNEPKQKFDSLMAEYRSTVSKIIELKKNYIRKNRSSIASGYLLRDVPYDFVYSVYDVMGDNVKNSIIKPIFDIQVLIAKRLILTSQNSKIITAGQQAPDFTLERSDSTLFSLSSIKDKYIVLDFWGGWNALSVGEFHTMIDFYLSSWRFVEFVGIDCRETKEDWLAAVKEYDIPWINVRNNEDDSDEDVMIKYGVINIPTRFIISPEGRILDRSTGNDPQFYTKLATIIRNNEH